MRTRLSAVIALVAVVLLLPVAGVAQPAPIKVGVAVPLTGIWAEAGNNITQGLELAISDINAAGGIKSLGGAKLQLVKADTGSSNPSTAQAAIHQLANEGVVAISGCYLSSLTIGASTTAEQIGVPVLTQSFADVLTSRGYKYLFQYPPTSSHFGKSNLAYVSELSRAAGLNIKKIAVVSSNDAAGKAQAETIKANATAAGFELVYFNLFPPDVTDVSVIVGELRKSGADFIFEYGPTEATALIIRTLRGLGVTTPIMGTGGVAILYNSFPKVVGKASDGVMSLAAWNWDLPYPGLKEVAKAYATRYKVDFMPQESGETYAIGWAVANAMEATKSADRAKIRDYLATANFTSGPAALMPSNRVSFDKNGLNKDAFPVLIEYKDGLPRTVWPKSIQQMAPYFPK